MTRRLPWAASLLIMCMAGLVPALGQGAGGPRHNVLIFVADGLRHGSVNRGHAGAVGVSGPRACTSRTATRSSRRLRWPTPRRLPPATAWATRATSQHRLDPGFATFDTGNFDLLPGTPVPFIENDQMLVGPRRSLQRQLSRLRHVARNGARDTATARPRWANWARLPCRMPAAIAPADGLSRRRCRASSSTTAREAEGDSPCPGPVDKMSLGRSAPSEAPAAATATTPRRRTTTATPARARPGHARRQSRPAELVHRRHHAFRPAAVDSRCRRRRSPWSSGRAIPDGTQHNQATVSVRSFPASTGRRRWPPSATPIARCRRYWPGSTRTPPSAEHGHRRDVRPRLRHGQPRDDRSKGRLTTAESAKHDYLGTYGGLDTLRGTLPPGFLALDLAYDLQLNVFDPDAHPVGEPPVQEAAHRVVGQRRAAGDMGASVEQQRAARHGCPPARRIGCAGHRRGQRRVGPRLHSGPRVRTCCAGSWTGCGRTTT